MKKETKIRLKAKWERFVHEDLGCIAAGVIAGCGIIGYFGAIANNVRIKKAERRLAGLTAAVNQHAEAINFNADVLENNARCGMHDRSRIEALERQQNLLMEQALRETKGEGVLS